MADIEQDVRVSIETDTFDKRNDFVVGRDCRRLDGQACEDAEALAAEFYQRYEQLEVDSDRRKENGEGDGQSIPTSAVVLVFGSALGKKLRPKKRRRRR